MMHRPVDDIPEPAVGERRMWCAVLAAVIEDYRKEYAAAVKRESENKVRGPSPDQVVTEVRRYFSSWYGRFVCSNAGFEDLRVDLVLKRVLGENPDKKIGRWSEGPERPVSMHETKMTIEPQARDMRVYAESCIK